MVVEENPPKSSRLAAVLNHEVLIGPLFRMPAAGTGGSWQWKKVGTFVHNPPVTLGHLGVRLSNGHDILVERRIWRKYSIAVARDSRGRIFETVVELI